MKERNGLLVVVVGIIISSSTIASIYPIKQSYQQQQHLSLLPSQLILSTRGFFDIYSGDITASGSRHSAAIANFQLNSTNCPDNLAIYVHGVWANEQDAKEQYNRLKDSYNQALKTINATSNPMPIVLYSWDSDTPIDVWGYGWDVAKGIANDNGRFLANSILELNNECGGNSHVDIHLIAHSMGARIVLSALDSLNNTNLKLKSVDLMGAAVDDEVVSKNPNDNQDSNFDNGVVYGKAIEKHVISFYNLFDPKDDRLRNNRSPYTYYPFYEGDTALGNLGIDPRVKPIDKPQNYVDINVQNDIPKNQNIDFTDANGDGICDLMEPIYFGAIFEGYQCGVHDVGDNHRGYMGFRDKNSGQIVDVGAMDSVAKDWMAN